MFNTEVTKLVMQYSRILDLVDYFEGVVKEQSNVIAFQEKIIGNLSMSNNVRHIEEQQLQRNVSLMRKQTHYNEKKIASIFKEMPEKPNKYEPFYFYGGSF